MQCGEFGTPRNFSHVARTDENGIGKTGGGTRAGELSERVELRAALIETFTERELSADTYCEIEAQSAPLPRLSMSDTPRHQLIDKEKFTAMRYVDRGDLTVTRAAVRHERLRHHFQPAAGRDLEMLVARGDAVSHLEQPARTRRGHEQRRVFFHGDRGLESIASEDACCRIHHLNEQRVRIDVPVRLADVVRRAERLRCKYSAPMIAPCGPKRQVAGEFSHADGHEEARKVAKKIQSALQLLLVEKLNSPAFPL